MIIRGGENVYPREIEEFLYTPPRHRRRAGDRRARRDVRRGDHGVGAGCATAPTLDARRRARRSARAASPTTRCPRYVHVADEFPMTVTGKVQKYKMREVAIEMLGLRGRGRRRRRRDGVVPGGLRVGHRHRRPPDRGRELNNDWWAWEHEPGSGCTEPSGDACDSWHRWDEDVEPLPPARLGSYRFSIEWSRIEPEEGEWSRAAARPLPPRRRGAAGGGRRPGGDVPPLHVAPLGGGTGRLGRGPHGGRLRPLLRAGRARPRRR